MALWCPDWPAVAAARGLGLVGGEPIAVLAAGRVVACSRSARRAGVRRGMRKRQAQSTCPELQVTPADPHRDGRFFDPVTTAVTAVVPMTEVLRPGLLVMAADRAGRYFGGETELAEAVAEAVEAVGVIGRVGVADNLFTAVLAARSGRVVPPGSDADFLADRPVADLAIEPSLSSPERDQLVNLLWRLGLRTLGRFAALDPADVASRFSSDAVRAHRMAAGRPGRRPSRAPIPPDLEVTYQCDPPVDRIDAAAFLGRRLAEDLHRRLMSAALACTRLTVHAITDSGQRHSRTWRCAEPLTPEATADRIRWQLEGWLTTAGTGSGPDGPLTRLILEPVELVDPGGLQHALTGAGLPTDPGTGLGERARRSLVRVQGLLGGEAVRVPVPSGGRGPAERVSLVTYGDKAAPDRPVDAAWPDALARPLPALLTVGDAELLDAAGDPVTVTARGAFSAEPVEVMLGRGRRRVQWWAGPWPFGIDDGAPVTDDDTAPFARNTAVAARAQVLLDEAGQSGTSRALLLCFRGARWSVEGVYE
ncbi:DNA polymerase Y family protein [Gordonia alkaliphila]|uniref:DNA polymerase Y family protein n=1 Tax=Gordonia alkaliphila TaxID=1053547 RepID=UPI001FF63B55|nr:DNA polymerase Y family protein [Gordonia alkaliphila]MCK0439990.1 DNA polymerase Y family protein [Gordonia alkaliphila]